MGESLLGLARIDAARRALERAVTLSAREGVPKPTAADARFALARAMAGRADQRERSRELATAAAALYRSVGGTYLARAQRVDAWLGGRP
jgi:hypothetical protein